MKKEVPKKKLAIFLVLSVLLITFTFYFYQVFFTPNILVGKTDRRVVIRPKTGFRDLRRQLAEQGVINDMVSFSFVARLMGYDFRLTHPEPHDPLTRRPLLPPQKCLLVSRRSAPSTPDCCCPPLQCCIGCLQRLVKEEVRVRPWGAPRPSARHLRYDVVCSRSTRSRRVRLPFTVTP